jgi:two-component system response regulator QseB
MAEGPVQQARVVGGWPSSYEGDAMAEARRAHAELPHFRRGVRILLVADNPDFGDWLMEELRYPICTVALANRGKDALSLIRAGLVDLVISEMGLPDLPGMDLLRELHGIDPMPKVLLTTSRNSEFLATRAMENGASGVLCKPFSVEQLFAAIARALGN